MAGLHLDPWQQLVLDAALGERADGKWAAFEVGVEVPRQNGKGALLEARELAGLFLLGERLIIHSAHEFPTSLEAFRRLLELIESTPDFDQRVKRVSRSHGEEGIELKTGQRIRFRTRTKGGGRGFSADCLILDEAMVIPEAMHGALLPTLSARPNPQVWYTGSAVDQESMEHGLVFSRLRARAVKGQSDSLAYFGWSAPADRPDEVTEEMARDPQAWAQGNPGLGIRMSHEHVGREQESMDPRTFAVERLGVGDWFDPDAPKGQVINLDLWRGLTDTSSTAMDPVCFAFDVRPDRSYSTIGAAGLRADGLGHVEIIDRRPGTRWVAERLKELVDRHDPRVVLCDGSGPAMSLLAEIEGLGVAVQTTTAQEHTQACGVFFDAVTDRSLRHLGTAEVVSAMRGAVRRQLGDAWAWSRRGSNVDISPLVAITLALWAARAPGGVSVYESQGLTFI